MKLKTFLALTLFLSSFSVTASELTPGIEAFEAGRFEDAKRLFLPSANRGHIIAQQYVQNLKDKKHITFLEGEILFTTLDHPDFSRRIHDHFAWDEVSDIVMKKGGDKRKRLLLEGRADGNPYARFLLAKHSDAKNKIDLLMDCFYGFGDLEAAMMLQQLGTNDPNVKVAVFFAQKLKDSPDSVKFEKLFDLFHTKAQQAQTGKEVLFAIAIHFANAGVIAGSMKLVDVLLECKRISPEDKIKTCKLGIYLGNLKSIQLLARLFTLGLHLKQNHQKAFELFTKAAEHKESDPKDWYLLGKCYDGILKGIPIDIDKALFWYHKAIASGKFQKDKNIQSLEYLQETRLLKKEVEKGTDLDKLKYLERIANFPERDYGVLEDQDFASILEFVFKIDPKNYSYKTILFLAEFFVKAKDKIKPQEQEALEKLLLNHEEKENPKEWGIVLKDLAFDAHDNHQPEKAIAFAERGMFHNDPKSFTLRGFLYGEDHINKFQCYKNAAELGESQAFYNLGVCYLRGTGTPKNEEMAVYYFKKALFDDAKGFAALHLANMMLNKQGGLKCNETEYLKLLENASQKEAFNSCYHLGLWYLKNDEKKAIAYLKKSEEAGNKGAKFMLICVEIKNQDIAPKEIKRRLDQLHTFSQGNPYLLGLLAFHTHTGFFGKAPRDTTKALKYAKQAADEGDSLGQEVYAFLTKKLSEKTGKPKEKNEQIKEIPQQHTKALEPLKVEMTAKTTPVESQKESFEKGDSSESNDSSDDEGNTEDSQHVAPTDWKKLTKEFEQKKKETASPSKEISQKKKSLSRKIIKGLEKLDNAAKGGAIRTQEILNLLSQFAMITPDSSMGFNGGSEYRTVIGGNTLKVDLNHGSISKKMTRGRVNMFKDFITDTVLEKGVFEDFKKE